MGDIANNARWYIARKQGQQRRKRKIQRETYTACSTIDEVVRQSQQVTNFQCSGNFIVEAFISRDRRFPSLTNASDTPLTGRCRRRLSSICRACSSRCCSNLGYGITQRGEIQWHTRLRVPLHQKELQFVDVILQKCLSSALAAFPDDYAGNGYMGIFQHHHFTPRVSKVEKQYHDKARLTRQRYGPAAMRVFNQLWFPFFCLVLHLTTPNLLL